MAHRLAHHASPKCATPHGHNEYVTVEIVRPGATVLCGKSNMLREFSELKEAWHGWIDGSIDHALQLSEHDSLLSYIDEQHPEWRIMVTPGDPTTELTAALFMAKCQAFLDADGQGFLCRKLTLQETPTNTIVLDGPAPAELGEQSALDWWRRADPSIR
jgi:6-pyruvoyltetrahydropterin/6-carboxytetrahydropterin synthase